MNKIGEVAFSKRLYQVIETDIGFKLLIFAWSAGALFLLCLLLYNSLSLPHFAAQYGLIGALVFSGFGLFMIYLLGIPPLASLIFFISPLRFRFYEEGVAISNYLVEKEHLKGYRVEAENLLLFVETKRSGRVTGPYGSFSTGPSYWMTQVSIKMDDNTKKLPAFLDRYGLPSDYIPELVFYKKIGVNLVGGIPLFPPS